jgi:hypothetical protein
LTARGLIIECATPAGRQIERGKRNMEVTVKFIDAPETKGEKE